MDNQTKNMAQEPQKEAQEPTSLQSGTDHQEKTIEQIKAENDQMVKDITAGLDQCNQIIRKINESLASLRVLSCAVTGFSRALDNFYAERSNHG